MASPENSRNPLTEQQLQGIGPVIARLAGADARIVGDNIGQYMCLELEKHQQQCHRLYGQHLKNRHFFFTTTSTGYSNYCSI